jgi:transcriptional antiterminator
MEKKKERRSKLEITEKIFELLKEGPTTPAQIREKLGLSNVAVDEYLDLIAEIQNQPELTIEKWKQYRSITLSDEQSAIESNIGSKAHYTTIEENEMPLPNKTSVKISKNKRK